MAIMMKPNEPKLPPTALCRNIARTLTYSHTSQAARRDSPEQSQLQISFSP